MYGSIEQAKCNEGKDITRQVRTEHFNRALHADDPTRLLIWMTALRCRKQGRRIEFTEVYKKTEQNKLR